MKAKAAFSLLELLVVVAIIALLATLAVPAFNSVNRGREIEVAGVQLADALGLARQSAMSKNRATEVRFFRLPGRTDPTEAFRTLQVFEVLDDGTTRPIGKPSRLPEQVTISEDAQWSSLFGVGVLDQLSATNIPGVGAVSSVRILRFRATGRTQLANLSSNYFLTILPTTSSQTNNFATVQIDPLTGRTRTFRP
jgi:uncharacterized protein (TIGR02596 family)